MRKREAWRLTLALGALAFFLFVVSAAREPATAEGAIQQRRPRTTAAPQPSPASAATPTPTPAAAPRGPVLNAAPPPVMPTPTPTPPVNFTDEETITVSSNLIMVPVSVTDTQGQPVEGLRLSDFRLEEEGRAQEIAQLGDADQVPIELALLLDVSGSVRARFAFQREAAAGFLREVLRPADRASIFAIEERPRRVGERGDAATATRHLLTIEATNSPTAFFDTVVDAARYLSTTPAQHRRVMIIISDGEDTFSDRFRTAQLALPEVQRADILFYSINPSGQALRLNRISERGQNAMRLLAEATGGLAFVPQEQSDLPAIFRQVTAELRSQYLLQYYSNSGAPAGSFRRINVRVPTRPDLRVRARQGFFVTNRQGE